MLDPVSIIFVIDHINLTSLITDSSPNEKCARRDANTAHWL